MRLGVPRGEDDLAWLFGRRQPLPPALDSVLCPASAHEEVGDAAYAELLGRGGLLWLGVC